MPQRRAGSRVAPNVRTEGKGRAMGMIVNPQYTTRYVPTGKEVAVFETRK